MSEAPASRPLILDVDTGIDDALALALAVQLPAADLIAVTTLAGNVDVTRATANTLAVLDWLGASDVPVYRGASKPLVRPLVTAGHVHGENGLGNAVLPASKRAAEPLHGPAALIHLARERPGALTLVCTGPLTNLAIALNLEPRLPELLDRLVLMGGAYDVLGNITPHAEFNIYCDPEAAKLVFAAPWPRAIAVGLDVTQQVALSRAMWERAADRSEHPAQLVAAILKRSFTERPDKDFYLHDPLALAVAVDPGLVTTEDGKVEVDLEGDVRGATRVTRAGSFGIARSVDKTRFIHAFAAALGLDSGSGTGPGSC